MTQQHAKAKENLTVNNLTSQHHRASKMVKVKVKIKFTLERVTKAQRGSRGIALLFL
jgi:hypothetical protein